LLILNGKYNEDSSYRNPRLFFGGRSDNG